uniref:Uncharacterized protein n=1 Tax=Mycena chlorophos TaxID=658473 RepID=A0ABQ0L0L7_MYCCL|nr:predicted protein [Mycena chlorophos]
MSLSVIIDARLLPTSTNEAHGCSSVARFRPKSTLRASPNGNATHLTPPDGVANTRHEFSGSREVPPTPLALHRHPLPFVHTRGRKLTLPGQATRTMELE